MLRRFSFCWLTALSGMVIAAAASPGAAQQEEEAALLGRWQGSLANNQFLDITVKKDGKLWSVEGFLKTEDQSIHKFKGKDFGAGKYRGVKFTQVFDAPVPGWEKEMDVELVPPKGKLALTYVYQRDGKARPVRLKPAGVLEANLAKVVGKWHGLWRKGMSVEININKVGETWSAEGAVETGGILVGRFKAKDFSVTPTQNLKFTKVFEKPLAGLPQEIAVEVNFQDEYKKLLYQYKLPNGDSFTQLDPVAANAVVIRPAGVDAFCKEWRTTDKDKKTSWDVSISNKEGMWKIVGQFSENGELAGRFEGKNIQFNEADAVLKFTRSYTTKKFPANFPDGIEIQAEFAKTKVRTLVLTAIKAGAENLTLRAFGVSETRIQPNPAIPSSGAARFTPDGKTVMVAQGKRVVQYDVATRLPTDWSTLEKTSPGAFALSDDGKIVAVPGSVDNNHSLKFWNRESGEEGTLLGKLPNPTNLVVLAPNGRYVAISDDHRGKSPSIRVWDLQTKTSLMVLPGDAVQMAFSPNSQLLAINFVPSSLKPANNGVQIFTVKGKLVTSLPNSTMRYYGDLIFSADGKMLAGNVVLVAPVSKPPAKTVDVWNLSTAQSRYAFSHDQHVSSIAFAPTGELLTLSKELRQYDLTTGKYEALPLPRPMAKESAPGRFSPDGRYYFLTTTSSYTLQVFEVPMKQ